MFTSNSGLPSEILVRQVYWLWNFLSYCLPGKYFISPPLLKDSFAGYNILGWNLALSLSLRSWIHLPTMLACRIAVRSHFPLGITWHVYLTVFRFLACVKLLTIWWQDDLENIFFGWVCLKFFELLISGCQFSQHLGNF